MQRGTDISRVGHFVSQRTENCFVYMENINRRFDPLILVLPIRLVICPRMKFIRRKARTLRASTSIGTRS